ncbi:MAG: DUF1707 domain-containing protein [Candidatus Nanopelagicales bacterium]|jgi:hypothetical protein
MVEDPSLRAGDADRDAAAAALREAYAQGRITQDELEQRLDGVHAAKTYGELAPMTSDLPREQAPASIAEDSEAVGRRRGLRAAWASWVGVAVIVNVVWFASWAAGGGAPTYYWPIWVMGPWGGAMVLATLTQRARGGDS